MKKEEFCELLGDINDNYVVEARAKRKVKKSMWLKWTGLAACLCLVIFGAFVVQNFDRTHGGSKLVVNEVGNTTNLDMDIQISRYNDLSSTEWQTAIETFESSINLDYEEFMRKIPDSYQSTAFYSIDVPVIPKSAEYIPHDYVFEFITENGGKVKIALCAVEEPLKDCLFECDNPKESKINGNTVIVYNVRGDYNVQFSYDNVNYDIETHNFTSKELETFLNCIMS